MTNNTLIPGSDKHKTTFEIIKQKHQETRERLKAKVAKVHTPPLNPPDKFRLEEFLSNYSGRLKSNKNYRNKK